MRKRKNRKNENEQKEDLNFRTTSNFTGWPKTQKIGMEKEF